MTSAPPYEVQVKQKGRSGEVVYLESGQSLPFFWEYITNGVGVSIPTADQWDAYCEKKGAEWARGRREEIVHNVAQALLRRYKKGSFELTEHWLNVNQGPSLISRLLSWWS